MTKTDKLIDDACTGAISVKEAVKKAGLIEQETICKSCKVPTKKRGCPEEGLIMCEECGFTE